MKILIGAGGMAVDFISHMKDPYGISLIDDCKTGNLLGFPIVGTVSEFLNNKHLMPHSDVYNCIGSSGDNGVRNMVYKRLHDAGVKPKNIIMSFFISRDVTIGENVLANIGSQIHHGCTISDNVVISPGATICGDVQIGRNVFIGAGATVIQGITIGENSVIAAGAVVTQDIPPNQVWGGVPAKRLKSVKGVV